MHGAKVLKVVLAVACVFVAGVSIVEAQSPATKAQRNPNPGLVDQLTSQLNISPEQAIGGTGAIFGLAKSRLNQSQFSQLAAAVPGMDGFLKAAPTAAQGGSSQGSLGSLGTMVSGAGASGGAGGLGSLAGSFQSLKLSPEMIGKFAPVLENYVHLKGGSETAGLLSGVLQRK
jgi:Protein of unknown function VcgC/VcgE (DUF2780)